MAVRATQAARKDPAAVAVADDPLTDLGELAVRLGEGCAARGLRVATVESCTGGLVGHAITEVPGLERLVRRRVRDLLGRAQAASRSACPTRSWRRTARSRPRSRWPWRPAAASGPGADLAVSVTGSPDPTAGAAAKPVGLTYVAVADAVGRRRPAVRVERRSGGQQAAERGRRPVPAARTHRGCRTRRPRTTGDLSRGPGRGRPRSGPAGPADPAGRADPRRRRGRCRGERRGASWPPVPAPS